MQTAAQASVGCRYQQSMRWILPARTCRYTVAFSRSACASRLATCSSLYATLSWKMENRRKQAAVQLKGLASAAVGTETCI